MAVRRQQPAEKPTDAPRAVRVRAGVVAVGVAIAGLVAVNTVRAVAVFWLFADARPASGAVIVIAACMSSRGVFVAVVRCSALATLVVDVVVVRVAGHAGI